MTVNFNIIHMLWNCLIYTKLFPTNCILHSFDAPTCFCPEPQPSSAIYSTWRHMQHVNATCQP